MAVTSMSGIEGMLQQMRAVVQTAQGRGVTDADLAPRVGGSFASELQRSLQKVSSAQMAASDQAKAFQLGTPGVALNDVMIDLQKASIGFQTAVQVRNKLVSAYKEISSMAV